MNKKFTLWLMAILCICAFQSLAQNRVSVTGTVKSAKEKETIPGVGVKLKGTTITAVTDSDGKFVISVPDGQGTLVFSYIGTKNKEIELKGQTTLEVILDEDVSSLSEVVVVGYGEQSRSTVTNSITRVGAKEFENAPSANPLNQLQGKVAGLSLQISSGQPGANPQIFIRGGASTSPEGDSPLFIVDGIVGSMRNISDINSDDIESMQVLKDAASTAIYGARAANGVIIIKTKSGKLNTKPSINLRYTNGLEQQGNQYDFTSAQDYVYISRLNAQKFGGANTSKFLTGGTYGMSTGNPRNSKNTLEFLDTYISAYGKDYVSSLIDNEGWSTMTDPVTGKKLLFKETNYQNETFQDANRNEYDFNINGGTEKSTYYVSLGHMNQTGIVAGTDYKSYNFLINGTYKLSEKWELNTNISYLLRQSNGIGNIQNVLSRSVTMPFTYRDTYENGLPAPGEGVTSFRNRQHEIYYRDQYSDNKVYRGNINLGATWKILPGLSFKPTVYWFTTEGLTNSFEAYNEVNINRNAAAEHSFIRQAQVDGVLNYVKDFAKHHTSSILGSSYINNYNYTVNASGYGAPTDNIRTVNATSVLTQRSSSEISSDIIMSFFGRINYDYDRKYLFSASLRQDGSSKFSEENKWALFPGVSAGWNVHNERFFAPLKKVVSTFKLRSSWGQAGQNELSIFDTQGQYSIGNTYLGEVGILNTKLANKALIWETTTSFDAGTDIGLFQDRVTLLVDYYNKRTSDRIFSKPIDATTGFGSITSNFGTIQSAGFDFELGGRAIKTKNFSWDVNLTFSYNKSIVIDLPENGELKNRIGGNIVFDKSVNDYVKVGGTAEGERYGGRWAYHQIGVYATDAEAANAPKDSETNGRIKTGGDAIWEDVDGNGIIDSRDMVFMGYIRPDKTGGMVNTFSWKNLTMRVVADFAVGHVIDNSFKGRSLASARNNNMTLSDVMGDQIWNEQGDVGKTIPKYTVLSDADYNFRNHLRSGNGLASGSGYVTANSAYHSKGDFLAFREVSLSYRLQAPFLKKAHIAAVNFNVGVYNIGYITKYDGLMPEIFTGNDQGSYPRPRQYNFSATLTF